MNMKRKDFNPKKELKDVKRLDTGRKRISEKAFIQHTMKRLSFDNKGTISDHFFYLRPSSNFWFSCVFRGHNIDPGLDIDIHILNTKCILT